MAPCCRCSLDGPEPVNHRGLAGADRKKALAFNLSLIERGVFVNPGSKFYLSLAHSDDDIALALEHVRAVFASMMPSPATCERDREKIQDPLVRRYLDLHAGPGCRH